MLVLAARIVLAAVMLVSAVMKLRDRGWPDAAAALGVQRPIALVVAPLELAIGAFLMAGVAVRVVSWVTFGLMIAFTPVLVLALAKPIDERPRCACFGKLSAQPVSVLSVVRNGVFAALAVVSSFG